MADKAFISLETRQAETHTETLGGVATVGGVVGITINAKLVSYTLVTGDTLTTAADGLRAAIQASGEPEFQQFGTVSASGQVVTLTARDPARFITATGAGAISTSSSGGPTIADAVLVAGKSPANANDAVNWQGGVLPADGDTLTFQSGTAPMLFDLSYLAAFDVPLLKVLPSYSGNGIGLPVFSAEGYREYRGGRLTLASCDSLRVELPNAAGPTSYRFDTGASSPCAVYVAGTGNPGIGQEQVDWIGADGDNSVEVLGAGVTIAPNFGETATLGEVKAVQGAVSCGVGVTLASVSLEDSDLDTRADVPILVMNGASSVVVREAAVVTTAAIDGGTFRHASSGGMTNLNVGSGGVADFGGSRDLITVVNCDLNEGGAILDPYKRVTWTNGIGLPRTGLANVTLDLGTNIRLNVSDY